MNSFNKKLIVSLSIAFFVSILGAYQYWNQLNHKPASQSENETMLKNKNEAQIQSAEFSSEIERKTQTNPSQLLNLKHFTTLLAGDGSQGQREAWFKAANEFHQNPNAVDLWQEQWHLSKNSLEDRKTLTFLAINGASTSDQKTFYSNFFLKHTSSDYPENLVEKIQGSAEAIVEKNFEPTTGHSHDADQLLIDQEISMRVAAMRKVFEWHKENIAQYDQEIESILSECFPQSFCTQTLLAAKELAPIWSKEIERRLIFKNELSKQRFQYAQSLMP